MMKICAGLGALRDYERLADAGADEFFAGYVPLDWLEKYANFTPLNRREVLMQGIQFSTLGEMRLLAERVHNRGVEVALAFNSAFYRPEQIPLICGMLTDLYALGFADWILADPALILAAEETNVPGRIHISGEAGCFSADAYAFFAGKKLRRLIFPRKMSPVEMAACIKDMPNYQYEAFILNERCHYSGAFCMSLHTDEMENICRLPYLPFGPDVPAAPIPEAEWSGEFGFGGCGICALPALKKAGVTHLKLVGRGADPALMERDLRILRRAVQMENGRFSDYKALPGEKCSGRCYYLPPFP